MVFNFAQTALLVALHSRIQRQTVRHLCDLRGLRDFESTVKRADVHSTMALFCLSRSISISLFGEFRATLHATGSMFVGKYWRRDLARTKAASIYFGLCSCRLDRKGIAK